jgi:hypothetical protein
MPAWAGGAEGGLFAELEDGFVVDDGGACSDDEHPASTVIAATAAAAPAIDPRNLSTPLICATLFGVMGFIGTRECCQA